MEQYNCVSANRLTWLQDQVENGRPCAVAFSYNSRERKEKIKFVLGKHCYGIFPVVRPCLTYALRSLAFALQDYIVTDKGHRSSSGLSIIEFWIAQPPAVHLPERFRIDSSTSCEVLQPTPTYCDICLHGDWRTIPPDAWTAVHSKFAHPSSQRGSSNPDSSNPVSSMPVASADSTPAILILRELESCFSSQGIPPPDTLRPLLARAAGNHARCLKFLNSPAHQNSEEEAMKIKLESSQLRDEALQMIIQAPESVSQRLLQSPAIIERIRLSGLA